MPLQFNLPGNETSQMGNIANPEVLLPGLMPFRLEGLHVHHSP